MTLLKMLSISFTYTHYIPCLTPPWGQNLYPKDNEMHNFGRHIPVLHHHAFRFFFFFYIHVVSEDFFFKLSNLTLFAPPQGVGNLKFTIYAPLVPKIHHIKYEKSWSSGYQDEVKNVQMCTDIVTLHIMFGPALGAKSLPRG
jgi:hypothetical protein